MAVQEAVPLEDSPHLRQVFGPEILGRLPKSGEDRVRRTALHLIGKYILLRTAFDPDAQRLHSGSYASWFTTQPAPVAESVASSPLMNAINYVVSALTDPNLCLFAANALRDLCDANRIALAPHISAFGELHASLTGIPVRLHFHLRWRQLIFTVMFTGHRKGKGPAVHCQRYPGPTSCGRYPSSGGPQFRANCNRQNLMSVHCRRSSALSWPSSSRHYG